MSDNIYAIHVSVASFKPDCLVVSVSCHICYPSRSDLINISTLNARNECLMVRLSVCPEFGGGVYQNAIERIYFWSVSAQYLKLINAHILQCTP